MRRLSSLVVAVYAAFLAWFAIMFRWDLVWRFWDVDDAYFYLTIARNIARGAGSTFDGLTPTNGYHPLWLAILAGAFRLSGPVSPETGVRIAFVLGIVCAVGGSWIMARLIRRMTASPVVQLAAVLGCISVYAYWFFGLEAHLNIVIAGAFFTMMWTRWRALAAAATTASADRGLSLALMSAALVFTRVDLVLWVALGLVSLALARGASGWSWRRVARLAAVEQGVSAALVLIYLVANRLSFGAWLPISAVLHTKPLGFSWQSVWFYDPMYTAHLAVLLGVAVTMLIVAFRECRTRGARALAGTAEGFGAWMAAGILVHCAIGILGSTQWVSRYTMTASCAAVLVAVLLAERWRAHARAARWIPVAAGVAAMVMAGELAIVGAHHLTPSPLPGAGDYAAFRQVIAPYLTPDSVAFMVDDAGEFGWFCQCHLINGDGLVNTWAYQEFVRSRRIREYLDQRGVQYVLTKFPEDADPVWVQGVDWQSSEGEFPIVGFHPSQAIAHVGWFWLFRYPDGAIAPPATTSGR